jgi:hypothetical protein
LQATLPQKQSKQADDKQDVTSTKPYLSKPASTAGLYFITRALRQGCKADKLDVLVATGCIVACLLTQARLLKLQEAEHTSCCCLGRAKPRRSRMISGLSAKLVPSETTLLSSATSLHAEVPNQACDVLQYFVAKFLNLSPNTVPNILTQILLYSIKYYFMQY